MEIGRTVAALGIAIGFSGCAQPMTDRSDPLVKKAVEGFEAGCLEGAPDFSNAAVAWRSLGISKLNSGQFAANNNVFGIIKPGGVCGVGMKGDARAIMVDELKALLARRGIEPLEERGPTQKFDYAAEIDIAGQEMGVAVDTRTISPYGYWTLFVLVPKSGQF